MVEKELIDGYKEDVQHEYQHQNTRLKLSAIWGLFSPREVDGGSDLLIKHLRLNPSDKLQVLDLGCGYGTIGLYIAKANSSYTVDLVDKDFVAVDYTNLNAKQNNAANAKAFLSNGFDQIPKDKKYDLIVANLPAKAGKELLKIWLYDAHQHLNEGGEIQVVVVLGLKEFIKRNLVEQFGNYEKVAHSKGYYVAAAVKGGTMKESY